MVVAGRVVVARVLPLVTIKLDLIGFLFSPLAAVPLVVRAEEGRTNLDLLKNKEREREE